MTEETKLKLGDLEIPAGAGRALTQTLGWLDNGDLRRTINGILRDMTREQNRKFESQISGQDPAIMAMPAFAGIWKGSVLDVECISKLRQNVYPAALTATLIRDPVAGSIRGLTAAGQWIEPTLVDDRDVTFSSQILVIEFRPSLSMMVVALSGNEDEYAAQEGWTIDLEEV